MNMKTVLIYLLTIVGVGIAGNFVIQYPLGTEIFRVDTAGDVNITGELNVTGLTNHTGHIDARGGISVTGAVDLPASSIDETEIVINNDWDIGSHKFTAEQLESDVATGTAPLIVASETRVSNLNCSYAGEADNLTCDGCINLAHIATPIVSSVDGVINDGGGIDLNAISGITITPDNGSSRINFTVAAGGVGNCSGTGSCAGGNQGNVTYNWYNNTGTFAIDASNFELNNDANITRSGITSLMTIDSGGNIILVLS